MKKIREPEMPSVWEPGHINDSFRLHRIDDLLFENEECQQDLSMLEFHRCMFRHISFTEEMSSCLFADCVFDHCDFSNVSLSQTVARRTQFLHCRMTGTEWINSTCEDMVVRGSHGMYANFSSSKMKRCLFTQSNFEEGAFSMCKWSDVQFEECNMRKVELVDSPLKNMDFSSCQLDGFVVRLEDLKGVILNADQALACTALLGIRVKE